MNREPNKKEKNQLIQQNVQTKVFINLQTDTNIGNSMNTSTQMLSRSELTGIYTRAGKIEMVVQKNGPKNRNEEIIVVEVVIVVVEYVNKHNNNNVPITFETKEC